MATVNSTTTPAPTTSPLDMDDGETGETGESSSLLSEQGGTRSSNGFSASWNFAVLCLCFGNTRAGTSVARFYGRYGRKMWPSLPVARFNVLLTIKLASKPRFAHAQLASTLPLHAFV